MADQRWPDIGDSLVTELRRHLGRVALIQDNEYAAAAVTRLAALVDEQPLHVGAALAADPAAVDEHAVVELLAGALVLTDIDALLWRPRFRLDVLRLLRVVARRRSGAVSVWPGTITGTVASYSVPGRRDHYSQTVTDALVLTPVPTTFDDDPPFEIQRIP